jgi:glycosyltransferase involved in cell wall biosynthesis
MYSENTFYINQEESIQGYKKHIPDIKTPDTIIYNGYDGNDWYKDEIIEREELMFMTGVGKYYDKIQYLKGFDIIIECAQYFPEAKFVIVGVNENEKPPVFSDNVIFHPVVNKEELFVLYNKASFYFQLSISEGFPNALSESMLCECIPIVSAVSSMPKIVYGCGFVVKKRDVNELISIVNHAVEMPKKEKQKLSKQSRDKVLGKYSLENRKVKLLDLIEQFV